MKIAKPKPKHLLIGFTAGDAGYHVHRFLRATAINLSRKPLNWSREQAKAHQQACLSSAIAAVRQLMDQLLAEKPVVKDARKALKGVTYEYRVELRSPGRKRVEKDDAWQKAVSAIGKRGK